MTRGGFLSAVQAPGRKGVLVVRARERSALVNLTRVVRGLKIEETRGRDYRYRVYVGQEVFAEAVGELVLGIDYGNFKDSVLVEARAGRVSMAYERALHSVWSTLGRIQPGGPYGWDEKPKRRRGFRRRRGADAALRDDLGVRELDLGEYGTWPEDVSVADELDAGPEPFSEEYEEWLLDRGIDRDSLSRREDADLASRWAVDADPLDPRFIEEASR